MTRFAVQITAGAESQARTIEAWWAANRPKSTGLFAREFAAAIEQLAIAPRASSPYAVQRPLGTRRLLLRRSGYHVYYTIDEPGSVVTIRAVWHAARGRSPRLQ